MSEVVDGQVTFSTISIAEQRSRHHARIQDKEVEPFSILEKGLREGPDGCFVYQIDGTDLSTLDALKGCGRKGRVQRGHSDKCST